MFLLVDISPAAKVARQVLLDAREQIKQINHRVVHRGDGFFTHMRRKHVARLVHKLWQFIF